MSRFNLSLMRVAAISFVVFEVVACASLPDTNELIAQQVVSEAQFDSSHGPLSRQSSANILAELKRISGDIDVLERQIVLEQAITDSPLIVGNKVSLLQDGTETYSAMFASLRNAKKNINLESYIIEDDEIGRQFSDLLLERQSKGIQVNVIYDSVGAIATPKPFYERLMQGGINVLEFNPVNPLVSRSRWNINHRDHRKLLVIDGATAFIGGINISSVYSSGSIARRTLKSSKNISKWRDTDIKIEGPVVGEFQKMFLQTWEKQRGTPLPLDNYFPHLAPVGKDIVRALGSTPDDPYSLIYITLISAINNAEKQVFLTNAYFVPDPQLLKALTDAAARGVDVKLILPSQSDSELVFHAGRSHYLALLKGGVHIYERNGAMLHSKTAVIDGTWSTVGSTNLDWRSFLSNDEINAVILGQEFSQQMIDMFNHDLDVSNQIELHLWERRSPLLRIKEWLAQIVGKLL